MPRRWVYLLRVYLRVLCCPWMPLWPILIAAAQRVVARPPDMRPIYQRLRVSMQMIALRVKCCVLASKIAIYVVAIMTICAVSHALRMPTWCSCASMAISAILLVEAWPRVA